MLKTKNLPSMWSYFKTIFFGPKGPVPKIQPLAFRDGLLEFRASEQLRPGRWKVTAPSKIGVMDVSLDVLSYCIEEDIYRAKVADEVFTLDAMRLERRGEFRLGQRIRATSADLPEGEAYTEDISLSGARLVVTDSLVPGDFLTVCFRFDDNVVPSLTLRCEVRWCAPKQGGDYHCGVRFTNMKKPQRIKLKRFIQNRVVMCGSELRGQRRS